MSLKERLGTVIGGGLSIGGIAMAAAFVGRRTSDPIAEMFLGDYSIFVAIGGVVAGLVLAILGFVVGIAFGNLETYMDSS